MLECEEDKEDGRVNVVMGEKTYHRGRVDDAPLLLARDGRQAIGKDLLRQRGDGGSGAPENRKVLSPPPACTRKRICRMEVEEGT